MESSAHTKYAYTTTTTMTVSFTASISQSLYLPFPPPTSVQPPLLAFPLSLVSPLSNGIITPLPVLVLTEVHNVVFDSAGLPLETAIVVQAAPDLPATSMATQDYGQAGYGTLQSTGWGCWTLGQRAGVITVAVLLFILLVGVGIIIWLIRRRKQKQQRKRESRARERSQNQGINQDVHSVNAEERVQSHGAKRSEVADVTPMASRTPFYRPNHQRPVVTGDGRHAEGLMMTGGRSAPLEQQRLSAELIASSVQDLDRYHIVQTRRERLAAKQRSHEARRPPRSSSTRSARQAEDGSSQGVPDPLVRHPRYS